MNPPTAESQPYGLDVIHEQLKDILSAMTCLPGLEEGQKIMKNDQKKMQEALDKKVGDIKKSLDKLNSKLETYHVEYRNKLGQIESSQKELKEDVKERYATLSSRIMRQFWEYELIITGLNDELVTEPLKTMRTLANILNIPDFNDSYVAKHFVFKPLAQTQGRMRPSRTMLVRFTTPWIRDTWMQLKKEYGNLEMSQLGFVNNEGLIYMNERSTTSNRRLLAQGKEYARKNGYKWCWLKHGKVFLKKNEGGKRNEFLKSSDSLEESSTSEMAIDDQPELDKNLSGTKDQDLTVPSSVVNTRPIQFEEQRSGTYKRKYNTRAGVGVKKPKVHDTEEKKNSEEKK